MTKEIRETSALRKWSRRSFLASAGLVGGGLALGLAIAPNRLKMTGDEDDGGGSASLNTWVKLTPDNRLIVVVPHSEMGQGAGTGLAQMLAEEMEADWDLVSVEQAPVATAYTNSDLGRGYVVGEGAAIPEFIYPLLDFAFLQIAGGLVGQMTGGSTAIRLTGHHGMRRAGASAKEMLLKAAAQDWGVPVGSLTAETSVVTHGPTGRTATYGELASRAATFTPTLKPRLKDPRDYKIVGAAKPRLDLPEKVTGAAKFGMDVVVPNMRYAALALPAVRDARAASIDETKARSRIGVQQVVNLGDAVAVVADSYWTASKAMEDLEIDWEGGQTSLSSEGILETHRADLANAERETMDDDGDVAAALERVSSVEAEYTVPYLAHATMEPMNCTAWVRDGVCDIWVGHQNPMFARDAAAETLGIGREKVAIHNQYLGGGFGRRGRMDYVELAARIAKETPHPVKVIWSREVDLANSWFRPAVVSRMRGAVEDGRISALSHVYIDANSGMPDSERPFAFQYDVPNRQIERVRCPSPLPVGAWRSVDFTQMAFFNETFMDELAAEAGADPLTFRLNHTSDPRRRAVLERLGAEANWGADLGQRRARGVAMVESFGTICGQVVEAHVAEDGGVRVDAVTSVLDCGRVINPDAAEAQVTGSVIFALTSALFGSITLKDGRVEQRNFPDYEMIRLAQAPKQTVAFMRNGHPPGGLGEPAAPPAVPALANAIFSATETRIRELPISKHGFRAA